MEDSDIPFNFFDFFGYLIPGIIFTIAIIWVLIPDNTYQKTIDFFKSIEDFKYIISVIIVIMVYGLGHVVSSLGSYIFEGILVGMWLGSPSDNLFNSKEKNTWPFSSYGKNYSKEFRNSFNDKFKEFFGDFKETKDRFFLCFTFVKEKCPATFGRLNIFISLYDFSRNSAVALLFLAIVSILRGYYLYAGILFVLTFIFISRYLKFFRIYGDEIFRTFYVFKTD
jgi:hypothetical protein